MLYPTIHGITNLNRDHVMVIPENAWFYTMEEPILAKDYRIWYPADPATP